MTAFKNLLYKIFGLSGNFKNKFQAFNVWLHMIIWLLWSVMAIIAIILSRAFELIIVGPIGSIFFVLFARFFYKIRGIR